MDVSRGTSNLRPQWVAVPEVKRADGELGRWVLGTVHALRTFGG